MKPQFSTIKFFMRLSGIVFVVACLGMSRAALAQSDVTPTPEVAPTDVPPPTDTPTDTATPLPPTDTPTATPIDTATPLPTDTPTTAPTDTPMPTDTPPPTDTPTATSTATPTDTPTDTATPLPTDTPTAMATPLPALLPFYDSFDAGTGWIASGSWTPDAGTAYSGSAWFADTTARNQTSTLESSGQIILNGASPLMTFWQQAHLSSADTVAVEISLDAGATWVTVDRQTALMANWQPHEVDLTPYAGQTIRLRFRVTTVGDVPAGEMSHGFWLDELTIQQPQPTATPTATLPATELPTATFTPTSTLSPTDTPTSSPQVLTEPQSSLSLATASTVTVNFAPSDDAEVKSAYPSSNYGSNTSLRTRNASGDIHLSYLKFNVAGISGAVQKAVLWVYVYDGSDDAGSVYLTSNAYRNSTTSWVQSGLNWSNAPALIGSPLSSAGSVASGVWISLDVTAVVKGNSVYSFVLTNNSTNSAYYNSKEAAANQPKLVVDFVIDSSSTNPTPTATPMATPTATPTEAPMPSMSDQVPPDCSHYPEPRTFLESQAWWWLRNADQTGSDFGHIHLGTCFPLAQTVSGNVEFDLRIIMHHNPSKIHHVIVDIWDDAPDQCYGGGVSCIDLSKQPLTCPMDQTCTWWVHLTAPTKIVPTDGRKEFRFRVFQSQPDGNRMFESTGWQAYVKNGKTTSNYRSSDFVEARGWYTEAQYQNARIAAYPGNLKTLDGVVSGVWKPSVALKPGSGGQPTDHYMVMIDPDFHSHMPSEGIVVAQGPGQYVGTVSIDTRLLSNGWHRLALRTDDDFVSITGECAQNKGSMCDSTISGVLVIWFNVKN